MLGQRPVTMMLVTMFLILPGETGLADDADVPQLIHEYVFRDLKINVGLNEDDINPDNPDYNFF